MADIRYSIQQRIWIIKHKYLLKFPISIQRSWKTEFKTEPPTSKTIKFLFDKWERTGSVQNEQSPGRPKTITTTETKEIVKKHFEEKPTTSSRRGSIELGIKRTSLMRILKDLKMKPYIPRLVQALNEDDFDRRVEFCEIMLQHLSDDETLIHRVIWSDEATFHLKGQVNRHNCVYYSYDNPNITCKKHVASKGISVWAGIYSGGIIGPFFFSDTVTAQSYVELLNDKFYPAFLQIPNHENYLFQQDGAPAHYSNLARQWLNENFDQKWIGRRGSFAEWPPRSPDLSVPDFFLWGVIRNIVYEQESHTIEELKEKIKLACDNLNQDFIERACKSVPNRLHACINAEGGHFENLC